MTATAGLARSMRVGDRSEPERVGRLSAPAIRSGFRTGRTGDVCNDADLEGDVIGSDEIERLALSDADWAGDGAGTGAGSVSWGTHGALLELLPMVRRIASKIVSKLPRSVELDDLIQAGALGLHDALTRFDEGLGVPVGSYAAIRVRGAMLDELRSHDWMCKSDRRGLRRREEAEQRLGGRLGRRPSESEIACELGVSLEELQAFGAQLRQLCYFEDMTSVALDGAESDGYLDLHTPHETSDPLQILLKADIRRSLHQAICKLPRRERFVITMHYLQGRKFVEISGILGVNEPRVSQMHHRAIRRLRVTMVGAIESN